MATTALEDHIASHYPKLPARLQYAADFLVGHQMDVATRSMRYVSEQAGLAPSTLTRLAQALNFESYENLRDMCRTSLDGRSTMAQRAQRIQSHTVTLGGTSFLESQVAACQDNLQSLKSDIMEAKLAEAVALLSGARQVLLYGAFSSTGITEYFSYLANFIAPNWRLAGRLGANLSTSLIDLTDQDAIVVITHAPFARKALMAAQMASEQKASVVVITNSLTCPALKGAGVGFVVPSESPHFFSSYAATITLIETLIGMLAASNDGKSQERIGLIEDRGRALDDFWGDYSE